MNWSLDSVSYLAYFPCYSKKIKKKKMIKSKK